jgi:CPA1 family monovalent cation:H+ antiporter
MSLITIVLVFMMAIVVTVFVSHLLPVKVPLPLIQIAAGAALAAGGFRSISIRISFCCCLSRRCFSSMAGGSPKTPFSGYEADSVAGDRPGDGDDPRHWPVYTLADPGYHRGGGVRPRGYSVTHRSGGGIGNDRQLTASSRMAHILEGESLLNDASGLVAFNFAIAAVLTGSFSRETRW